MALELINSVITALRPLQADFSESVSEINNLWEQLKAVERTKIADRDKIATLVRLNLTDSIDKFEAFLAKLSAYTADLRSTLSTPAELQLSASFESDIRFLLSHLDDVHEEYEDQLGQVSDCMDPEQFKIALNERNLFEESFQLRQVIQRIRADLLLIS